MKQLELREIKMRSSRVNRTFILPGIMGSYLSERIGHRADLIWLKPNHSGDGSLDRLSDPRNADRVFASGVVHWGYARLKMALSSAGFDARFLPYDWRRSVEDVGADLLESLRLAGNRQVSLVCHGMGGLVGKRMAELDAAGEIISKVVMIGTPTHGSFVPLELFRLTSPMLARIARFDQCYSASAIARRILVRLPGLVEMLPDPRKVSHDFFDPATWPVGGARPTKTMLAAAGQRRHASRRSAADRCAQIIAVGTPTIVDAKVTAAGLGYVWSNDGDGTVPRALAEMEAPEAARYYVRGAHGGLCNHSAVIDATRRLLSNDPVPLPQDPLDVPVLDPVNPHQAVMDEGVRRQDAARQAAAMDSPPRETDLIEDFVSDARV